MCIVAGFIKMEYSNRRMGTGVGVGNGTERQSNKISSKMMRNVMK